jgi:hypothetical protein
LRRLRAHRGSEKENDGEAANHPRSKIGARGASKLPRSR